MIKILMLVNWKVAECQSVPDNRQSPDYVLKNVPYWFFKYFQSRPQVDVVDMSSCRIIEKIERKVLHVHIIQGLRAIFKMSKYDLIISHGMTSAVVVAFWQTFFRKKNKIPHIVFDIGCFNSAATKGITMKWLQKISKSFSGIIYHTACQKDYYHKFYPWLDTKSCFIRFGPDQDYFLPQKVVQDEKYFLCIGAGLRDWATLVKAYDSLNISNEIKLVIVGHTDNKFSHIKGVIQKQHVSIDVLKKLISGAFVSVLPLKTYYYSYGQMTLLQQMAMGKCVITADVPPFKNYGVVNRDLLFYIPENVEDLREKMKTCILNPELVSNIGHSAYSFIQTKCNEVIMSREIEVFITRVLGNEKN